MKKQRSKLPVVFLFLFLFVMAGSITLGFMSLKPKTGVIEQNVTLPLTSG